MQIKKIITKVAFIDIKDRKMLFVFSINKNAWFLPGGKLEQGETDKDTLMREIKEEIDISLRPQTIRYFGTFEAEAHGQKKGTLVRSACYLASYKDTIIPQNEIKEYAYFGYKDRNKLPILGQVVLAALKKKGMID